LDPSFAFNIRRCGRYHADGCGRFFLCRTRRYHSYRCAACTEARRQELRRSRVARWLAKRGEARKEARRTVCEVCGETITAERSTRRTCSPRCRQRLHRQGDRAPQEAGADAARPPNHILGAVASYADILKREGVAVTPEAVAERVTADGLRLTPHDAEIALAWIKTIRGGACVPARVVPWGGAGSSSWAARRPCMKQGKESADGP
jgi:hypothetical protein